MRTRAKKTDAGWTINGQKMWISMGNVADVALIFAQTDPEKSTAASPASWSRPRPTASSPGDPRQARAALLRHRRDPLDDVEVPDDAMLGEVGDGFKVAMTALDNGRYWVAAGCVGSATAASTPRWPTRRSASSSASRSPLPAGPGADRRHDRQARRGPAAGLPRRALKDRGKPNTVETSIAKLYATEAAVECANAAIQVHGGSGYVDDYPVERYLRDARVTTLYEGTSQIQQLIIGRDATGINAMVRRPARNDGRASRRRRRGDDGRRNRADRGARRLSHGHLRAGQQGSSATALEQLRAALRRGAERGRWREQDADRRPQEGRDRHDRSRS